MRLSVRPRNVPPILLGLLCLLLALATAAGGDVGVELALSQQFYYEGDGLDLRITVVNRGDEKLGNPVRAPLLDGLHVRQAGELLEPSGEGTLDEPTRPEKLAPGSFYGGVVALAERYPELTKSGTYEIYWSADQILSDMIVVTVIPRYDPAKSYLGEVETTSGSFTVDLLGRQSPIAVKSFIDLAQAGFYDGLAVSEVRADELVVGGDPRSGDSPRQPIRYPAEQSALPLVAGTVVMRPVRATPPSNGSAFAVLLKPQPSWTGQVTVLGQVVEGLEVVQKISRVPSTMRGSQPNFKPLEEIRIRQVTIREKAGAPATP